MELIYLGTSVSPLPSVEISHRSEIRSEITSLE